MNKLIVMAVIIAFMAMALIPVNAYTPTNIAGFNSQPAPYANPYFFQTNDNNTWIAVANYSLAQGRMDLLIYPCNSFGYMNVGGVWTINGSQVDLNAVPFMTEQVQPANFPSAVNLTDSLPIAVHSIFIFDNDTQKLWNFNVWFGEGQYYVAREEIDYTPAVPNGFTDIATTMAKNYTVIDSHMQNRYSFGWYNNNSLALSWASHDFRSNDGNASVFYACNAYYTLDTGGYGNTYIFLYMTPTFCAVPTVFAMGSPVPSPYAVTDLMVAQDASGTVNILVSTAQPNANKWNGYWFKHTHDTATLTQVNFATVWKDTLQQWIFPYSTNWQVNSWSFDHNYNHTVTSQSLLSSPECTWYESGGQGSWNLLETRQRAGGHTAGVWNITVTGNTATGAFTSQTDTPLLDLQSTNVPTSRLFPYNLVINSTNIYNTYLYSSNVQTLYYYPIYQNDTAWSRGDGIPIPVINTTYTGYGYPSYVTEDYIITCPSGKNYFNLIDYWTYVYNIAPTVHPAPPAGFPAGLHPAISVTPLSGTNAPIGYMILLPFALLFIPSILVGFVIGRTGFFITFALMLFVCGGITVGGIAIIPAWLLIVVGIGFGVMLYLQFTGRLGGGSSEAGT